MNLSTKYSMDIVAKKLDKKTKNEVGRYLEK